MTPQDFLPFLPWLIGGMIAVPLTAILANFQLTRLKIRHGYPLQGMWGQSLKPGADGEAHQRITLLTQENTQLSAELGALGDRMASVERIVTDSGYRLGHEIERLRQGQGNVQ